MAFDISAADIVKLGKIAWQLWEQDFSQAKNAAKQYAEFGADIQYFARNLQQLGLVIEDVDKQIPVSLSPEDHDWDLKSLLQICGNFRKTLKECEQLLGNTSWFERGRDKFIHNIRWNLSVELQVTALRNRVAVHNIKIATVLKPLELKLLLDLKKDIYNVHSDLASQITGVNEILRRIENNEVRVANEETGEIFDSPPVSPRVPDYLEERFEAAIKATNPELLNQAKFPLVQGINAFHRYFEQSTSKYHPEDKSLAGNFFTERTPEPTQFLNLMKSIWIIQMIKRGDKYAWSVSDKLWECYVRELDEKSQREFSRFTKQELPTKRLKEPDRRTLILLREEEFGIWLKDEDDEFEYQPDFDSLNEILHIPLVPGRNHSAELVLLRRSDSDTQLELHLISRRTDLSAIQERFVVNLPDALFVPLYATPSSTPDALNIVFKGNKSDEIAISLRFLTLKDLLEFQRVICGYRVDYDDKGFKILAYDTTNPRRVKRNLEHVRVQIWSSSRLEGPQQSQSQLGEPSQFRKGSIAPSLTQSLAGSVTTSEMSHLSLTREESPIEYIIERPDPPMLVFYLSVGGDRMSLLTFEMGLSLNLQDYCYSCGWNRSNCIHSTIGKSRVPGTIVKYGGSLRPRRVEADSRHGLNLTSLGVYQKPKNPYASEKMNNMRIEFKTLDERLKFEDQFMLTQQFHHKRLSHYYGDIRDMRNGKC